MSIVHIRYHNENIYNVCSRSDEHRGIPVEKNIYKSTHAARVKNEKRQLKTFRQKATMGPAIVDPPEPTQYLKKYTGRPAVSVTDATTNQQFSCSLSARRPEVPLKFVVLREQDEKLKHPAKNFIARNISAASKLTPKTPLKKVVVDQRGRTAPVGDGIRPKYIFSAKFGHVPKYINRKCERSIDQNEENISPSENVRCIKSDQILQGLKRNWAELQEEFQRLPLLIDTIAKRLRKNKLEEKLKQLEKDIVLLQRHPYIYVYNDDTSDTRAKTAKSYY